MIVLLWGFRKCLGSYTLSAAAEAGLVALVLRWRPAAEPGAAIGALAGFDFSVVASAAAVLAASRMESIGWTTRSDAASLAVLKAVAPPVAVTS